MENVILECNNCNYKDNGCIYQDDSIVIRSSQMCRKEAQSHLLKILMEPCTKHPQFYIPACIPNYYNYKMGKWYHSHKKDCPDCIGEIQRQVNG